MTEPIFLTFEDVIEIHRDQIVRYGGAFGIREVGLLQSAVLMPLSQFGGKFLHKDLFEMAAALPVPSGQEPPLCGWKQKSWPGCGSHVSSAKRV